MVFQCQAAGVPTPTIKWVKYTDGSKTEIRTSARFIVRSIDRNGTVYNHLNILRVQWSDAGRYGCEAQNKHGRTVADAYLTILTGLVIQLYASSRLLSKVFGTPNSCQKNCIGVQTSVVQSTTNTYLNSELTTL